MYITLLILIIILLILIVISYYKNKELYKNIKYDIVYSLIIHEKKKYCN